MVLATLETQEKKAIRDVVKKKEGFVEPLYVGKDPLVVMIPCSFDS